MVYLNKTKETGNKQTYNEMKHFNLFHKRIEGDIRNIVV